MTFWLIALSGRPCKAEIRGEPWEPEARNWIKVSSPASFFREKSFLSQLEAERLVLKLYDAGALFIGVIFINKEPQGFRVSLPMDTSRREAVFGIINKALERAGFMPFTDGGQDDIAFWIMKDSYE